MLTPKCRSRDSHVRARADIAQNRLCCWNHDLRRRNLGGFCEKLGLTARPIIAPGRSSETWLCWQSEANPSLPAEGRNAGRFRQKAGKAATNPCRTSRHLNTLDPPLPNLASRESAAHSREGTDIRSLFGELRVGANAALSCGWTNPPKVRQPTALERQSRSADVTAEAHIPIPLLSIAVAYARDQLTSQSRCSRRHPAPQGRDAPSR
jgi:hypothetical protein